jgi:hypothetical protein
MQAYKARDRLVEAGTAAKADAIAHAAEAAENVITAQAALTDAQAAVAGKSAYCTHHQLYHDCMYTKTVLFSMAAAACIACQVTTACCFCAQHARTN